MPDYLERRVRRAAESLMENESLTEGLDTEAANTLLNWGIRRAEDIALDTNFLDEEQAQAAMYPRLRALRQFMSSISTLISHQDTMLEAIRFEYLEQICAHAALIYGPDFIAPDAAALASLLQATVDQPQEWIESLRAALENRTISP